MKKLIIIVIFTVIAWNFKNQNKQEANVEIPVFQSIITDASHEIQKTNIQYKCDGRQYCSQMTSFEEAKYFNNNCPDTKMDGDEDGIPCERQFGY